MQCLQRFYFGNVMLMFLSTIIILDKKKKLQEIFILKCKLLHIPYVYMAWKRSRRLRHHYKLNRISRVASVLGELRLYWAGLSLIDSNCFCYINTN